MPLDSVMPYLKLSALADSGKLAARDTRASYCDVSAGPVMNLVIRPILVCLARPIIWKWLVWRRIPNVPCFCPRLLRRGAVSPPFIWPERPPSAL